MAPFARAELLTPQERYADAIGRCERAPRLDPVRVAPLAEGRIRTVRSMAEPAAEQLPGVELPRIVSGGARPVLRGGTGGGA